VILIMLSCIFVPVYTACIKQASKVVCEYNCRSMLRSMELYAIESEACSAEEKLTSFAESSKSYLTTYDICPDEGNIRIRYQIQDGSVNVTVRCTVHKYKVSRTY
jgi:hypothetical protein